MHHWLTGLDVPHQTKKHNKVSYNNIIYEQQDLILTARACFKKNSSLHISRGNFST